MTHRSLGPLGSLGSFAMLPLLLLPALTATSAMARGYGDLTAVGGRIGLVDVDDYGTTFTIGGTADFGLSDWCLLNVGLDYFKDTDEHNGIDESVRDISIGAFARFLIPTHHTSSIQPFAGAGLTLHMLEAEAKVGKNKIGTDHDSTLGLDLGGGMLIPSSPSFSYVLDVRYRDVNGDDIDADHIFLSFGVMKAI